MSEVLDNNEFIEHLEKRFNEINKNEEFNQLRKNAFSSFKKNGLPTKNNEEYKYTNLKKILETKFSTSSLPIQNRNFDSLKNYRIDDLDSHQLVFINGHFSKELSDDKELKNVKISSIANEIINNNENLVSYFQKQTSKNDSYYQLNHALSEDGIYIELSKNAVISKPIILYFINDTTLESVHSNNFNIIHAKEGANAIFLRKNIDFGKNDSFVNSVNNFLLKKNSNVIFFNLNVDCKGYQVASTQVQQLDSSTFSGYDFTTSGKIVRNNLDIVSDGENCESNMYGLYLLDNNMHVDNHTSIDHQKPNSTSNELYKGIIKGKSRGVFNGKVFVRPLAQKTNAFQANKNVLLSKDAIINTKPQLEIWADDVKCSHGCTTGQLDQEILFYLRSRGINYESSIALLLRAFASEVLEKIKIEPLKNHIDSIVSACLNQKQ